MATAYRTPDGEEDFFNPHLEKISRVKPVYRSFPGWCSDTSGKRRYRGLPAAARDYIRFIEEAAGAPVGVVSVGRRREQTIRRS